MTAWTKERRARQRETIMRSAPWRCSTGPHTAEGKARSAQNARKHGWYTVEAKEEDRRAKLTVKAIACVAAVTDQCKVRFWHTIGRLDPELVVGVARGDDGALDEAMGILYPK